MSQPLTSYESCRLMLISLRDWYEANPGKRNEATTRLVLIDRLFFECLGWTKEEDVVLEEYHDNEFADYAFSCPRTLLIVEAKKEGDYFELPAGMNQLEFSLQNLLRDYPKLKVAVEQATHYCQSRGVPFGAVCNGHQLVAFIAVRTDGVPPLKGKALVFPSLDSMVDHFLDLWQALSKSGLQEKLLQQRLIGETKHILPPKPSHSIHNYPGVKARNVVQTDLQIVSEVVLEDLTRAREIEKTFLTECYCKSGALSQYSLTSKAILAARYSALFSSSEPGPTTVPASNKEGIAPELFAESLSRRPILLIGDVGVGKSIFINHLLKVDAASLANQSITLSLDLASQAALSMDIRLYVCEEFTRQLRQNEDIDVYERNFVRGVYDLDLIGFRKGIYSDLQQSEPGLFMQKEIEFLEGKLQDKHQHLKACIHHIAKGRSKQVIIIIDNADQRDDQVQQQAFLIAQEFAEQWIALVYVSLRPETFYRSKKFGALSGYHAKAFTISPPRIDQVVEKRLHFALKITSGQIPLSFTNVNLQLDKLDVIIRVFLDSLSENTDLGELLDNISGGNVRLALDLVRGFFGSGHADTGAIIEIYRRTKRYTIPLHQFLRAVIFGDAVHYDPRMSPIANVFDLSTPDPKEHFLCPLLIGAAKLLGSGQQDGFVETQIIYERLQSIGFTPDQIEVALARACRANLLEATSRRAPQPGQDLPAAIRSTTVGLYHVFRLVNMFAYIDAMIVDISILDQAKRVRVTDVDTIEQRLERVETVCQYLSECWGPIKTKAFGFDWSVSCQAVFDDVAQIKATLARKARHLH